MSITHSKRALFRDVRLRLRVRNLFGEELFSSARAWLLVMRDVMVFSASLAKLNCALDYSARAE